MQWIFFQLPALLVWNKSDVQGTDRSVTNVRLLVRGNSADLRILLCMLVLLHIAVWYWAEKWENNGSKAYIKVVKVGWKMDNSCQEMVKYGPQ